MAYYIDTGLCVFCDADDVESIPHDDDCDVGAVAGVVVDGKRRAEKSEQRRLLAVGRELATRAGKIVNALGRALAAEVRSLDLLDELDEPPSGEEVNDGQPDPDEAGRCV